MKWVEVLLSSVVLCFYAACSLFLLLRLLPSSTAFSTFCCVSLCLCHSRKKSSLLSLVVSCFSPLYFFFFFFLRKAILYLFLSQVPFESQIFKINYWMHFFICITVTAAVVDIQWYSFCYVCCRHRCTIKWARFTTKSYRKWFLNKMPHNMIFFHCLSLLVLFLLSRWIASLFSVYFVLSRFNSLRQFPWAAYNTRFILWKALHLLLASLRFLYIFYSSDYMREKE